MSKYNWIKYNSKISLIKKINNYNKENIFNYFEKGHYNHTRDMLCLCLVLFKKNKKKVNLLDYGSNLLTYANLTNKINLKNYNISIFDPFCKTQLYKNNIYIFSDEKKLDKKWDIVNFGSSIQYIDNLDRLNKINFKKTNLILITHTPISSKFSYKAKQLNSKNLYQNIYSFKELNDYFNKKKFKLIFKSRNEDKFISAKQKCKTYSANLLFLK